MRKVRTAALDTPARLRKSLRGTSLYLNALLDLALLACTGRTLDSHASRLRCKVNRSRRPPTSEIVRAQIA